jgi:hypothetical protein
MYKQIPTGTQEFSGIAYHQSLTECSTDESEDLPLLPSPELMK